MKTTPSINVKIIEAKIIANGIKNLKEYGYHDVSEKNIFTDLIYSGFFESMLNDNLGKGFDKEINSLLKRIKR